MDAKKLHVNKIAYCVYQQFAIKFVILNDFQSQFYDTFNLETGVSKICNYEEEKNKIPLIFMKTIRVNKIAYSSAVNNFDYFLPRLNFL